ncbi:MULTISPECIES: Zn-dependent hydrolase [Gracilibacillus]|uniref:Zn-dependent hydrolase n=1 Tax=Gracilibacillus TaxID=74385 RepID=UPI000B1B6DCE|nr:MULTISPECIES: Zn-dependent hydrolase [Gracilibacillus]
MKHLTIHSVEFQQILHNLHIEDLQISSANQKKILDLLNAGDQITPAKIKELYQRG